MKNRERSSFLRPLPEDRENAKVILEGKAPWQEAAKKLEKEQDEELDGPESGIPGVELVLHQGVEVEELPPKSDNPGPSNAREALQELRKRVEAGKRVAEDLDPTRPFDLEE